MFEVAVWTAHIETPQQKPPASQNLNRVNELGYRLFGSGKSLQLGETVCLPLFQRRI
jgi:hypothetical protein